MSGDIEAVGDMVTGGLIARAIEPDTGANTTAEEEPCLNCGTMLIGPHCHACGQKGRVHRTLRAFAHDLLHGVLHFEGKIWGTLPMLFWKPGELTRRYVHGERAKFVSPLALFLFSVFMMFAVLGILGSKLEAPTDLKIEPGSEAAKSVSESKKNLTEELAAIDRKIAAAEASNRDSGDLKRERANVAGILRVMEGGPSVITQGNGKLISDFKSGWARLDNGIAKANQNPNLLLYKLQSNAYKFSWALIPLSVPFVWLLFFWKRKFKMYDHAVFVTYSLSFMTLLAVILTVVGAWGIMGDFPVFAFMVIAPIHIYKQIKGAYGLSRLSALIRTSILLIMTTFVLISFVFMLLALGVMG